MKYLVLRCGNSTPIPEPFEVLDLSAVPTRQELKTLDTLAHSILPVDPTPSLEEIAAQPEVRHLGSPQLAPQPISDPLRIIVLGSDAALSAILTRMMRADYLWVQVAFIALDTSSTAARNWDLPTEFAAAWDSAVSAPVRPVPLIRNDSGIAVAGYATISAWPTTPDTDNPEPEFTGEIIVDNDVLVRQAAGGGLYGARLVPMLDAPGILAAPALGPLTTPSAPSTTRKKGFLSRLGLHRPTPQPGELDTAHLLTGRAVQAGGPSMKVIVDGISAKRPVDRVTFYRHLRDLQIVRP